MSDAPQFIITIQRIIIKTHDILTSDSPIKTLFTCFPEVPKYINTALMLFFLSLFFFLHMFRNCTQIILLLKQTWKVDRLGASSYSAISGLSEMQ